MQVSAFYRGCSYIATQVGKLPWDIKTLNNKLINSESDIWGLLNRAPNEDMSAFNFRVLMVYQCLLRGNGFAEVIRNGFGKIVALYPIMNQDICAIRDAKNKMYYQIYNTVTGDRVYLRQDEVLHFRNIHTEDGINGLSVINYAAKVLGIAAGADKMAGALYENGGLPSGVLETDATLNENVIERLKESWKKKFGRNKAGGVAVLEQGMKFNAINFAPDVLQFLESRQFSVIEIARMLSVPPSKLYVIEAQTYNNIEHASLEVGNDTIDVWAKNFEGEVDRKLLDDKDHKTDMDLYAIFRGDMKTRGEYFSKMMGNGAITPNEIRTKEGMEEYDEGNEFYISSNNLTPVSRQDEIIDSQIKEKDNKDESELTKALTNKINKKR